MMKSSYLADLAGKLNRIVKDRKVVILCVGNPVRGDDGAPQLLFRKLRRDVVRLRLLDCGTSPQDCVEEVVELEPNIVIFVNAVDRSLKPGSIILDELQSTVPTASSLLGHKMPLAWAASLLKIMAQERNIIVETFLIGIQISSTKSAITVSVRNSVSQLLEILKKLDSVANGFASSQIE